MKVLEVNEDGSLTELPDLQLKPESVIIIVDEVDKRMWLWKGQNCQIRKKFIGSRALSDLRKKNMDSHIFLKHAIKERKQQNLLLCFKK